MVKLLTIVWAAGIWCTAAPAAGAGDFLFAKKPSCGQNMSCIPRYPAQTRIAEAKLNYSHSLPAPAENPCVLGAAGIREPDRTFVCEEWIATGRGTPRQRAADLFFLGHRYALSASQKGNNALQAWLRAIETLDRAISADPTYFEAYVSKGQFIAMGRNPLDALPALDEAIRIAPDHWWPRAVKANALMRAGRFKNAIEAGRRSVELAPNNPPPAQALGAIFGHNKQFDEAEEWYLNSARLAERGKAQVPGLMQMMNPWHELALIYSIAGRWGKADETITRYMASIPESERYAGLFIDRANYRELMGLYGDAADDLEQAARMLSQQQDVRDLRMRRAMLLVKAGRSAEAEGEFKGLMLKATLQRVLQLQVFLKNAGFDDFKINGEYDELTQQALRSCLRETACLSTFGQRM